MAVAECARIYYSLEYIAQPTPYTCWRTATAMALGIPPYLVGRGGSRFDRNDALVSEEKNIRIFAEANDMTMRVSLDWPPSELYKLLRDYGPLVCVGWVPRAHAYAMAGLEGDCAPGGTTLILYDPARSVGIVRRKYQDHLALSAVPFGWILHSRSKRRSSSPAPADLQRN